MGDVGRKYVGPSSDGDGNVPDLEVEHFQN
jgi:hypothetical protein